MRCDRRQGGWTTWIRTRRSRRSIPQETPMAAGLTWGASWLPPTSWHCSTVGAWQEPRP